MSRRTAPIIRESDPMTDILWLAVLAGLFLITLAFVRLCHAA
jgi:hypothetical protein